MTLRSTALLLFCAALTPAADQVREAHDQVAQLAAEAVTELDRMMAKLASEDQASRLAERSQQQADRQAIPVAPVAPAATPPPSAGPPGPAAVRSDTPLGTTLALATTQSGDPVQDIQGLLAAMGLATGIQAKNGQTLIVCLGQTQVHGKPGTPSWIAARSAAYQTAMLRARADMAAVLGETVLSGRSLDVLETPPQLDTGAPPPASREQIAGKAKTLAEAQLDAELRKLGIPPEQYEKLPPEQRRTLYAERYEQSIRTQASAALAGCATLAVTEGPWQGSQVLCVALVWSQNLARLAAIANRFGAQLPPKPPAPGRRILEQIGEGAALARRFGVQRYVDETGDIVIVAYGQSALLTAGPGMRAAALGAAFDKAALEAKAMLKDFIWQETDTEATREFAQLAQATSGERSGDLQAALTQQERFQRTIRSRSSASVITGGGELRRWIATVDGAEAAGVVLAWSPRRQHLALNAVSGPGSDVTGAPAPAQGGATGTATFDPSW